MDYFGIHLDDVREMQAVYKEVNDRMDHVMDASKYLVVSLSIRNYASMLEFGSNICVPFSDQYQSCMYSLALSLLDYEQKAYKDGDNFVSFYPTLVYFCNTELILLYDPSCNGYRISLNDLLTSLASYASSFVSSMLCRMIRFRANVVYVEDHASAQDYATQYFVYRQIMNYNISIVFLYYWFKVNKEGMTEDEAFQLANSLDRELMLDEMSQSFQFDVRQYSSDKFYGYLVYNPDVYAYSQTKDNSYFRNIEELSQLPVGSEYTVLLNDIVELAWERYNIFMDSQGAEYKAAAKSDSKESKRSSFLNSDVVMPLFNLGDSELNLLMQSLVPPSEFGIY